MGGGGGEVGCYSPFKVIWKWDKTQYIHRTTLKRKQALPLPRQNKTFALQKLLPKQESIIRPKDTEENNFTPSTNIQTYLQIKNYSQSPLPPVTQVPPKAGKLKKRLKQIKTIFVSNTNDLLLLAH